MNNKKLESIIDFYEAEKEAGSDYEKLYAVIREAEGTVSYYRNKIRQLNEMISEAKMNLAKIDEMNNPHHPFTIDGTDFVYNFFAQRYEAEYKNISIHIEDAKRDPSGRHEYFVKYLKNGKLSDITYYDDAFHVTTCSCGCYGFQTITEAAEMAMKFKNRVR